MGGRDSSLRGICRASYMDTGRLELVFVLLVDDETTGSSEEATSLTFVSDGES